MMLPTHALVGMALALPIAMLAPDLAPAALLGGFLGGILPDLDLYAGHRRTLHFPTLYPIAAVPAALLAFLWPTTVAIAVAFVLIGAAAHCRMDIYGGGLELRPWEGTSDHAVYDHVARKWLPPRRFVAYDGSKGDLGIATLVAAPLVVLVEWPFVALVAGAIGIGVVYALLRRRLAALAPVVFGRVPDTLSQYVPARYRDDTSELRP
ncbi:MAG: metal-dependent hydrolase [Halobacteriota archaeon]|uniref:metal-dependent hydrolase n=1 Tax=Natronomonas sp. TaxID=2184060 RepID=UPI003974B4CF